MSDLISKTAVIEILSTMQGRCDTKAALVQNSKIWQQVKDMPTVEAEPKWIPVFKRLPETIDAVNVTWINRQPESYYADIKDKPFTGTAHYCKGKWWWDSCVCQDYLNEYGNSPGDEVDEAIEIVAWMPLPKPYEVKDE